MDRRHPRDRYLTVFGKKPVLEALALDRAQIARVLLAHQAKGEIVEQICARAAAKGVTIERVSAREVTKLSRNARQDQGVVADLHAPAMAALEDWLELRPTQAPAQLLVLDGLTNPANVGLILRSALGAGLDGVVVPRVGCPEIGPLVIKASAGAALAAPILRTPQLADALAQLTAAGFAAFGLAAAGRSLWTEPGAARAAWVVGNETWGLSPAAARLPAVAIPLAAGAESLNAAVAASILAFELARRRVEGRAPGARGAGRPLARARRSGGA